MKMKIPVFLFQCCEIQTKIETLEDHQKLMVSKNSINSTALPRYSKIQIIHCMICYKIEIYDNSKS